MKNEFFFILVVALIFTLVLTPLAFKLLQMYFPTRRTIQRDIDAMRKELIKYAQKLIPFKRTELDILSLEQVNLQSKKRFGMTTAHGVFQSIYQEPMIAYSFKQYLSKESNALLYARTYHKEYVFRIIKDETQIIINGTLIGRLLEDGSIFYKKKKKIGQLQNCHNSKHRLLTLNGKEIGYLNLRDADTVNQRAIEFLKDNLSAQEEDILIALCIHQAVASKLLASKRI